MRHFLHPTSSAVGALVFLCACFASATGTKTASNLVLEFAPEKLTLVEGVTMDITLNIIDNSTSEVLAERPWMASPGRVTVSSDTPYNLDVLNGTFEVSPCDFLEDKNYTVTLRANSLGYAQLEVFWEQLANTQTTFNLSACYEEEDTYEEMAKDQQPMPSPLPTVRPLFLQGGNNGPVNVPKDDSQQPDQQAVPLAPEEQTEAPLVLIDELPNQDVINEGLDETDGARTDMANEQPEDVPEAHDEDQNTQDEEPDAQDGEQDVHEEEQDPQDEDPQDEEQDPQDEEQDPQDEEQDPQVEVQDPQDEEQDPQDEEPDPQDEEQTPQDEEQDPQVAEQTPQDEEQDAQDEEQDPQDEEQTAQDEEHTAQDEEQEARVEEQDAQDEEHDAQDEEHDAQDEEHATDEDAPTVEQENNQKGTPEKDKEGIESDNLVYEPKPPAPPQEDIATSSPEKLPELSVDGLPEAEEPKKKRKNKKPEKMHVYREGITFLFKRSQELSVEEETPVATKVLLSDCYRVTILRDAGTLDTVFVVVVSMAVIVNTLMMGMQIDLAVVWGILKKPIGPAVGFFSQFAFMPAASYVLGLLLLSDPNLRLGLFTLGCSPGGNGSNFWTLMLKGDLNLSITMTLISTISSLFMMPMWLFTLGQTIVEDGHIGIPFGNLILSLFSFTIPVAVGVSIRRCKPTWANFAGKIIRPFTLILILSLLALAIWNSLYVFRLITWQMIVAGLSIAWGGYVFGAFVAFVCRQKRAQIIAISIETAIQNPGITFMVLRLTLPQPDSDISAVAPVAQLLVTSTPLLAVYLTVMIYRKCKACKSRKMEEQLEEANRKDVDAADPLLINRTASILPSNGTTTKEKNGFAAPAKGSNDDSAQTANRRESPPPPYPGVNMYAQLDDKDLEKNENATFAKELANKQDSVDAVPLRKLEHIYVNFKNEQKVEPLRESKV